MSKYIIARGVTKTHRIAYLKRNINIKLTFAVSVKPSNGVISGYASKFIENILYLAQLDIKFISIDINKKNTTIKLHR